MKRRPAQDSQRGVSRREFLKRSSVVTAAGTLGIARSAHAAGDDTIKIALIGCGGRGTGAAVNALSTKAKVKLVALADAFQDRVESSLRAIEKRCPDGIDVPPERRFAGFDAYQQAIDCGVDMVLLCTPPGFRPIQFEAAVKAGKHVFMEKPVAVDAPGVRRVLAANEEAKKKNLAVAVGFHLRHERNRMEVAQMVKEGAIGELIYLRAYHVVGQMWTRPRQPKMSEMEYQLRNWQYFNWLSGDHIVEQHVHDIDAVNWLKDDYPVRARGMGGRQVRIGKDYGEIFDHHAVEFDYAAGTKMFSFARQIPGCWNLFADYAHGTKGEADLVGSHHCRLAVKGQEPKRWGSSHPHGHQAEHDDLFAALLAGQPYNEADYGAKSTMTAVMGRMATYSGKVVTWEEAFSSELDLSPECYAWDTEPPVEPGPNGLYACAMPGVTKAW